MNTKPLTGIIPAGSLIIFSLGLDEDAYNKGAYRATQDIRQSDAIDNYAMYMRDERPDERPFNEGFCLWMLKEGLIEEVDTVNWYLGDHDRFDPHHS
ncbi:hypothetical protein HNR00_003598 [Methylorubrum rhodinum]|uniref:Uncharacterized protein n=1 Tax=Methylorubrum rhodinum TaxID=29428 RepID=A0A840ZPR6_9HYPH|nr:hypothetical protein [Methylorubrum rhodinum]MBB5758871.1 hypothetical protein [Methylorubrum rhodinum]